MINFLISSIYAPADCTFDKAKTRNSRSCTGKRQLDLPSCGDCLYTCSLKKEKAEQATLRFYKTTPIK